MYIYLQCVSRAKMGLIIKEMKKRRGRIYMYALYIYIHMHTFIYVHIYCPAFQLTPMCVSKVFDECIRRRAATSECV